MRDNQFLHVLKCDGEGCRKVIGFAWFKAAPEGFTTRPQMTEIRCPKCMAKLFTAIEEDHDLLEIKVHNQKVCKENV